MTVADYVFGVNALEVLVYFLEPVNRNLKSRCAIGLLVSQLLSV